MQSLLLRLFTALVLIYGTQDNILHHERMLEFRDFVARHHFPMPLYSAYLSAYAQFITGILIAVGLFTRPAAALMIINFVAALWMVHRTLPFAMNIAPLAMLVNGIYFTLVGAPEWSIDAAVARKR